jgi:hypothetical protein
MIGRCGGPNRRFEFEKRSQFFVGAHNETLSVAPMCICNPDRSPFSNPRLRPDLI